MHKLVFIGTYIFLKLLCYGRSPKLKCGAEVITKYFTQAEVFTKYFTPPADWSSEGRISVFHSFLLDSKSFLSRKANGSTKIPRVCSRKNLEINLVCSGVLLSLFWILESRVTVCTRARSAILGWQKSFWDWHLAAGESTSSGFWNQCEHLSLEIFPDWTPTFHVRNSEKFQVIEVNFHFSRKVFVRVYQVCRRANPL